MKCDKVSNDMSSYFGPAECYQLISTCVFCLREKRACGEPEISDRVKHGNKFSVPIAAQPAVHTNDAKTVAGSSDIWAYCYAVFPCLQVMRSGRIVHGALLLLAAVTSANSAKCNRLIDGVTAPKSNAEGRYNFVMTQYNRTIYNFYMPNTRYNGKYTITKGGTGGGGINRRCASRRSELDFPCSCTRKN